MNSQFHWKPSRLSRANQRLFKVINRFVPWYRLPTLIGLVNVVAFRSELREKNLHDTEWVDPEKVVPSRMTDGTYNDLGDFKMGAANRRFARNVPVGHTYPEQMPAFLEPNPRLISTRLLKRDHFVPATTLNLLAAAWVQFQTHDWFNHGKNRSDDPFGIPIEEGDSDFDNPMLIERTMADPTRTAQEADRPPTYINPATHWWDSSGIYGSDEETTRSLRTFEDGKLILEKRNQDIRLPLINEENNPKKGISKTGFNENWWLGLVMLHTLFAQEHNAICDALREEYPTWTDQQLFDKARLINSALIAKIHTVEWTPAILGHPTLRAGMRANWWGLLGKRLSGRFGLRHVFKSEILTGIPGSPVNHHGAPYALTEEFAAVYRMHPLIRDDHTLYSFATQGKIASAPLTEVFHDAGERIINENFSMVDAFYSFGRMYPGAITLHNYPDALRNFTNPTTGAHVDLAAVDIVRDRERGVPRYADFRTYLHRKPATTFEDITGQENVAWANQLREVYDNDISRVDPMVGMYAEPLPPGFGFSETAFRVFILMASRRLKSDRFLAENYIPEIYTSTGIRWVEDTTMSDVLHRHFPTLAPALEKIDNAFAPWVSEDKMG
jgi:hypothetical protein